MNSTLQDIMGLLNRYKTKVPTDNDYIVIAGHTSRGVLVPQPTLEANVTTLGELKKYIQTSAGSTPTLQQVTDEGNVTTNDVKINQLGLWDAPDGDYGFISLNDSRYTFKSTDGTELVFFEKIGGFAIPNGNPFYGTIAQPAGFTENRSYDLPDASGTIALTSDIPDVSTFVPYTGATSSLDMGNNSIFVGVSGSPNNITLETQSNNGVISNSPGSKLMLSPDSLKLTDNQFGGSLKLNLRPTGLTTGNNFLIEFPAESGKIPLIKYKVYTALLTQTGTSAPVATVLENTLSTLPTWVRDSDGQYRISNISFDPAKTFCIVSGNPTSNPNFRIGSGFDGFNNRITVSTLNFYSSAGTDSVLNNTSIEIRVYN
jgi:hypothetical protein